MELLSGQWFYWAASKYECVSLCEKVSIDVNETELKGFLFDVCKFTNFVSKAWRRGKMDYLISIYPDFSSIVMFLSVICEYCCRQ